MCEEEDYYEIFDHDIDEEEFNKLENVFNTEKYPVKRYDPQMTKLSFYTQEYCGTKKPPKMTKVYVAPHLKEDHTFISRDEWITFIRSLEKNKLYRLSDLVLHFNRTMRPRKQLNNRGFGKLKFVKDSFIVHKFHEKDKDSFEITIYYNRN